jgi:small subunit ribosomal protein S17
MPKRVLEGVIVSDKMDKTIVVKVERRVQHPIYKKFIRRSKRYHAHDETNAIKVGQTVRIMESRPLSKTKRWVVLTEEAAS